MSDATIPDRFNPAIRWVLAGIALFVFFLLGAEKFADQQYVSGAVFSVLFAITLIVAVKWNAISDGIKGQGRKHVALTIIGISALGLALGIYLLANRDAGSPRSGQEQEWFSVADAVQRFGSGEDRFASLEAQLRSGALIARGFRFPAANDASAPTSIDAPRWQFLHFDRREGEIGKAGGGMSTWVGIQIARGSASSVSPPAPPKKFYSEADKSRLSDAAYALSTELSGKAVKAIDAAKELAQLFRIQAGPPNASSFDASKFNPEQLRSKFNEIRELLAQHESDIADIISDPQNASYRDELLTALGGTQGHETLLRFREALDSVGAHVNAFEISDRSRNTNDNALNVDAAILGSMHQCIDIMQEKSTPFASWVNESRTRIDDLRRTLGK
jgi:hypothetical protein